MRCLILAAGLIAGPAAAQSTTTDCRTDYFGNVRCESRAAPAIPTVRPDSHAFDGLINSGPDYARIYRESQAAADAKRTKRQQARAAEMIAAGDCAGAERFALENGNLGLAQAVKAYCSK